MFVPLAAQIINIDDDSEVGGAEAAAPKPKKPVPTPEQPSANQISVDRLATMRKNYEKRIQEKWRKALKVLGINENLYPSKREELSEYEPFKTFNI